MGSTKGEWLTYADYAGEVEAIVVKDGKGGLIKIANLLDTAKEKEANAHLIAAAPDMHEALKIIRATLKAMPETRSSFSLGKLAQQALVKAEGGS